MTAAAVEERLQAWAETRSERLVEILRTLVRIPSVNQAPFGTELECQRYVADALRASGLTPSSYSPDDVPGISAHPLFWPGRDYTGRPNVMALRRGAGGGRSLVLSGHVDTVPVGSSVWTHDPFGGTVEGNRLYGRGSNDMKCGVATNLFVAEALHEAGVVLRGDLTFESVVDEEFGGVNGTLAGRLMGPKADAAVISEPSFLRICPAQRGGRTVHISFAEPARGLLDGPCATVVRQLQAFLNAVDAFSAKRRTSARVPALYAHLANAVPATITRIHTAPWGTSEPTIAASQCQVEFFIETVPGETCEDVDRDFSVWFSELVSSNREIFSVEPKVEFPIRWLPGSAISPDEDIIRELHAAAVDVTGSKPAVQGIEGPCDMFVFHEFGVPAVLWGARGGNTHGPDEFVEIDSMVQAAKVLLAFVCRWCGVKEV
jgi:acetylornithine deacetylase